MSGEERQTVLDELLKMKEKMDSLYADSVACVEGPPGETCEPVDDDEDDLWQPPVDVLEDEQQWLAVLDLPGVGEENLNVEMADGRLLVRGTRGAAPAETTELRTIRSERPCGCFHRQIPLPAEIREDGVEAELKHGVLTIRIAKQSQPAKTRRIAIHSA